MNNSSEAVKNGAEFEKENDFVEYFRNHGFDVVADKNYGFEGFRKGEKLSCLTILRKCEIYDWLSEYYDFDSWQNITSKRNEPDTVVVVGNTFYVIEMKYQKEGGYSQEALLPYCDFKKKQYQKLLVGTGLKVKFCFLLSESFEKRKDALRDTFDYIEDVGCQYFIGHIPLDYFGL